MRSGEYDSGIRLVICGVSMVNSTLPSCRSEAHNFPNFAEARRKRTLKWNDCVAPAFSLPPGRRLEGDCVTGRT